MLNQQKSCLLCCQDVQIFGIFPCNHGPFCHICTIKIQKNNNQLICPICKSSADKVVFSYQNILFKQIHWKTTVPSHVTLINKKCKLFYYTNQTLRKIINHQKNFYCNVYNCPQKNTEFQKLNNLKKHLDNYHHLNDICLDNNSNTIKEQKLYTEYELDEHLKSGQLLQNGIQIYHPYCKFCKKYLYDQQKLIYHLKKQHYKCDLCPEKYKYLYYDKYENLQKHYDKSHYLCQDQFCITQRFIAFRTKQQREEHIRLYHQGEGSRKLIKKAQVRGYLGFFYDQEQKEYFELKDNEGFDFTKLFISTRKHYENQVNQIINHKDEAIDIRDFMQQTQNTKYWTLQHICKRSRLVLKQSIYQKDIDVFCPLKMHPLSRKQFDNILYKNYSKEHVQRIKLILRDLYKLEPNRFATLFKRKLGSQTKFFYLFPLLIRTLNNNKFQQDLDYQYLQQLMQLPRKTKLIILNFTSHGKIIQTIFKQVKKIIEDRIKKKIIDLDKYWELLITLHHKQTEQNDFFVEKEKVIQLIHIINRIPTKELVKFKWILKMGIPLSCYHNITKDIYCLQEIKKLSNKYLAIYSLYILYCYLALFKKIEFQKEKEKVTSNILKKFLENNYHLFEGYNVTYKKLMNFEEHKIQKYQKNQKIKKANQTLQQTTKTKQKKSIENDQNFPSLIDNPQNNQPKIPKNRWTEQPKIKKQQQTEEKIIQQQTPQSDKIMQEQNKNNNQNPNNNNNENKKNKKTKFNKPFIFSNYKRNQWESNYKPSLKQQQDSEQDQFFTPLIGTKDESSKKKEETKNIEIKNKKQQQIDNIDKQLRKSKKGKKFKPLKL